MHPWLHPGHLCKGERMMIDQIVQVVQKAVDEAIGRMSMDEVRDLVVAPYVEIRERLR